MMTENSCTKDTHFRIQALHGVQEGTAHGRAGRDHSHRRFGESIHTLLSGSARDLATDVCMAGSTVDGQGIP